VAFGRARDIEFHLAPEFVVGVDEGNVRFNGLAHAGVGEMFFHALPIALVGRLLAELGEVVLAWVF
jgi:hypothetical protein